MKQFKDKEGNVVGYAGKIVGPVIVTLPENYHPGKNGQPTIQEFGKALRRELSDFLDPSHEIIFL
ncbi:hypothetical protein J4225_04475 [Candidatus Pacearchaeota archaeon]|nr:hypothetical protein [Candidatus Pacearchaeota archaeon]